MQGGTTDNGHRDVAMDLKRDLKPTLLLALAFFMASAPNPDANAIAEMTAGFITPDNPHALHADELPLRANDDIVVSSELSEDVRNNIDLWAS